MNRHIILLDSQEQDYLLWDWGSGGTVEIRDIAVNTERRKGRGRLLVKKLREEVQGKTHLIFAITRASNLIARQFYAGIGFRLVGVLGGFYSGGENAMMYGRDVGNG